jgi:hypothetical protein
MNYCTKYVYCATSPSFVGRRQHKRLYEDISKNKRRSKGSGTLDDTSVMLRTVVHNHQLSCIIRILALLPICISERSVEETLKASKHTRPYALAA